MTPYIFLKKKRNKFRLVYTIVFSIFFAWPFLARSQQRKTEQSQLLTLPTKTIRLDSLGSLVANESSFVFSFNANKIKPEKKITIPSAIKKLSDLLSYLNEHYKIGYRMIGNHIILYKSNSFDKEAKLPSRNQENHAPQKMLAISNKEKATKVPPKKDSPINSTILPGIGASITLKIPSPILPEEVEENLIKQSLIPQMKSPKPASYPKKKTIDFSNKQHNTEKGNDTHNIHFSKENNHFYASAGLTASEVLYFNPQIRVGLPWLFALAGWKTNFKTSGFFYGLGTSIKLSDNWNFQLSASSGALSKDFRWSTSTSDTIGRIEIRLTRIDILAKIHLSKRWVLQFGPVLNLMKSKYSLRDSSIANSFPPSSDVSKDVYIIEPPYTLSNSYNKKTGSGKKMWIGIQIGIFYTLW